MRNGEEALKESWCALAEGEGPPTGRCAAFCRARVGELLPEGVRGWAMPEGMCAGPVSGTPPKAVRPGDPGAPRGSRSKELLRASGCRASGESAGMVRRPPPATGPREPCGSVRFGWGGAPAPPVMKEARWVVSPTGPAPGGNAEGMSVRTGAYESVPDSWFNACLLPGMPSGAGAEESVRLGWFACRWVAGSEGGVMWRLCGEAAAEPLLSGRRANGATPRGVP